MKSLIVASILTVFTAQAAMAANCTGFVYQYKKAKSDKLVLSSMESTFFKDGAPQCFTSTKTSILGRTSAIKNCVAVKAEGNKVIAVINDSTKKELVEASQINLPYDTGTHLELYFGRDAREGRFKLGTIVDLKNDHKDVLAIGVNCK